MLLLLLSKLFLITNIFIKSFFMDNSSLYVVYSPNVLNNKNYINNWEERKKNIVIPNVLVSSFLPPTFPLKYFCIKKVVFFLRNDLKNKRNTDEHLKIKETR